MANNREVMKITIDAADVIKTLKAVQREARETTKSLRELEASLPNAWVYDVDDGDVLEIVRKDGTKVHVEQAHVVVLVKDLRSKDGDSE